MVAGAMTSQKHYKFDFRGTLEPPDLSQGSLFPIKIIISDRSVLGLHI